jgi:hypothetical protein
MARIFAQYGEPAAMAAAVYTMLKEFSWEVCGDVVDELRRLAHEEAMVRYPNLAALREPCDPGYLRKVYGDPDDDEDRS